jgi:hypothetical protein
MGSDWYTFSSTCGKATVSVTNDPPPGSSCFAMSDMTKTENGWRGKLVDHDDEEFDEDEDWLCVVFDDVWATSSHHVMGCYDTSAFREVEIVMREGGFVLLTSTT